MQLSYEAPPAPLDAAALAKYRTSVLVYVNGRRHEISAADSNQTLLEWLRSAGYTGTKLGCGEGGCGACTVVVSSRAHGTTEVRHAAINACLMPLPAADWCAVTTVEGIGSARKGAVHPIQARMAALHGSQCGFCTPGIVMAMYGALRAAPHLSASALADKLDGNLCRCTGYRPILDAAATLCVREGGAADGGHGGCAGHGGGCGGGNGGCGGGNGECGGGGGGAPLEGLLPLDCHLLSDGDIVTSSSSKLNAHSIPYAHTPAAAAEPPLPPELLSWPPPPLHIPPVAGRPTAWWRPAALEELLALKAALAGKARVVVGASEVTIEARYKNVGTQAYLSPTAIAELTAISDSPSGITIGACAPLSAVEEACAAAGGASRPGCEGEAARAVAVMLRWFASTQIRNVACLAGNVATASPISDMLPTLLACRAKLTLASAQRGTRTVPLDGFVTGYRKIDLAPDELILSFFIPHTQPLEFIRPYKQARRREDDISIVTSALRIRLSASTYWEVADATLAYGGMRATVATASSTAAGMVGKAWNHETVREACKGVLDELKVAADAPGGQPEFRSALASSFLFKFFVATSAALSSVAPPGAPPPPVVAAAEASAGTSWLSVPKPHCTGQQRYPYASLPGVESQAPGSEHSWGIEGDRAILPPQPYEAHVATDAAPHPPVPSPSLSHPSGPSPSGVRAVGEPLPHAAGLLHTTGEAEYTDDAGAPPGTLHGWLIRAEQAPALLASVDAAAARQAPGVAGVFLHGDLPGNGINSMGPIAKDELCFAVKEVLYVGQVIGIVAASTAEQARHASSLVSVSYAPHPSPPVYTIDAAIASGSFFDGSTTGGISTDHQIEAGVEVEEALKEEGLVVVQGEFRMGGQEHFYLEPMTTLVTPTDDGGLSILCSTQAVDKTQKLICRVLGLPAAKVIAKCRRMGGGFGGKETRTVFAAAAAAAAAHALNLPVRLCLRRDVDMGTSGGRHPFVAKYTAAARPDTGEGPKLAAFKVQLYSNGGATLDLSGPVMDRALLHVDGCYKWPAFSARGIVCRTHTPPNTAFRGFGGPQGQLVVEAVLEHLASALAIPVDTLRASNWYKEGDALPFGTVLQPGEWRVPLAYTQLQQQADVAGRRAAIDEFNATHTWRKRGLALLPTKFGINFTAKFMNQGGALVHVYTDGTVLITHGGTEMGQGLHTKVCQVAARAFGIPVSSCHVAESASDKVPNAQPTAASAGTDMYGMATLDACRQILKRLAPVRARLGPAAPFAQLCLSAWLDRVDLSAHGFFAITDQRCGFDWDKPPGRNADGTPDQTVRGHPFNYFTQGVAASEVEVDVLTGDHSILRADILVDLGSSINPALDIGQIEGAFVQGAGWTTTEELLWGDEAHPWVRPGRLFNAGPGGYKLPAFNDAPAEFNVRLLSGVDNKVAVHSSKAVGEPPFFLGASVFFALKDALAAARQSHLNLPSPSSHFVLFSPATSERIRLACGDTIAQQAIGADAAAFQPKGSF